MSPMCGAGRRISGDIGTLPVSDPDDAQTFDMKTFDFG